LHSKNNWEDVFGVLSTGCLGFNMTLSNYLYGMKSNEFLLI
jgi:hypothetical protein